MHSGVALAMARAAKESNTLLIVPNAGADAITGPQCAPNIFRTSFSNWQPGYATGVVAAQKGYKRAMTITWNYAAGTETVKGFTEAFEKGGGKVIKDLTLPFPNVEFQALLTEIAAQKPDVVFAFFAGGGAVKFVKDYDARRPEEDRAADRLGLPDRRHAGSAGRQRAGPDHVAALRRRHRHAAQQRLPQQVRGHLQGATRRLCGAGLRRRAAARRRPDGGEGRLQQARRDAGRDGKATIDSPRGKFTLWPRTTRCRTSTSARPRAART